MRAAQAIEGDRRPASHRLTIEGEVPSTSLSFEAVQFCSFSRFSSCSRAGMRDFAMTQALPNGKNLSIGKDATRAKLLRPAVAPWQHQGVATESFGQILGRYVGKGKAFKQADVARRLGTSDATVSRWISEGRVPDTLLLVALADLLHMAPKDLLGADYVEPIPADAAPTPRQGRPPSAATPEPNVTGLFDAMDTAATSEPKAKAAKTTKVSRPKPGRATQR